MISSHIAAEEALIDHGALILEHLAHPCLLGPGIGAGSAEEGIAGGGDGGGQARDRFRDHLELLAAEEFANKEMYQAAYFLCSRAALRLRSEQWWVPLTKCMRIKFQCALRLLRRRDVIHSALHLLSPDANVPDGDKMRVQEWLVRALAHPSSLGLEGGEEGGEEGAMRWRAARGAVWW